MLYNSLCFLARKLKAKSFASFWLLSSFIKIISLPQSPHQITCHMW